MMIRSKVTTRTLSTAAVLTATFLATVSHGASDELSLVQVSARRGGVDEAVEEEEAEEDFKRIFHRGHEVASLLAVHIPGVKGIKEQLQEVAAFKPTPGEKGYHEKVVKALPKLRAECKSKAYATEADCNRAVEMLSMMEKATEGPEPPMTWHNHLRSMVGFHFWLYLPGTMLCFSVLDMDQSKGISHKEMEALFGAAMVAALDGIWRFLDQDSDGNITREELHNYLRAAILIREYLPELDPMDPTADTRKCLNMAHRVLAPPAAPTKRLKFYPKLLSIAGIAIGAVALHCLLCTRSSKKAMSKPDLPVGKDRLGK